MNSECLEGSLLAGTPVEPPREVRMVAGRRASALNLAKRLSVYFSLAAVDLGTWYALWKFGQWALR